MESSAARVIWSSHSSVFVCWSSGCVDFLIRMTTNQLWPGARRNFWCLPAGPFGLKLRVWWPRLSLAKVQLAWKRLDSIWERGCTVLPVMDLLTEGDLVQITKCGEQEFFSQPRSNKKINTEHATVIFKSSCWGSIDWVTKLPSKCGTYKGTVHTRDRLPKLAPELTSEEAGRLLSSYVTHYYSLPRHVHTIRQ